MKVEKRKIESQDPVVKKKKVDTVKPQSEKKEKKEKKVKTVDPDLSDKTVFVTMDTPIPLHIPDYIFQDVFAPCGKIALVRTRLGYSRLVFETIQGATAALKYNGILHQEYKLNVSRHLGKKFFEQGDTEPTITSILQPGDYRVHVEYKSMDGSTKVYDKNGKNLDAMLSSVKTYLSGPVEKKNYWALILSHLPGSKCKYEVKEITKNEYQATIILFGNKDFKKTALGPSAEEAKYNALAELFSVLLDKKLVTLHTKTQTTMEETLTFDDLEDIGE
jgi:hypothetical protein